MIRKVRTEDAEAICNIYNYYVDDTIITFEEKPVDVAEMRSRIGQINANLPWFVYCDENHQEKIFGYAYAASWRSRSAFQYSVESSVYIDKNHVGKGIGSKLYQELINKLISLDFHAIIGGIAIPNDESIKLHERLGFEKVAHFNQVGKKFDQWIDVEYWQLSPNKYASLETTPA